MESAAPKVRIGVSSCLLGAAVRWDGGDKRDVFLTDGLGPAVEWVPVCPEVELGMGVPREPVELVRAGGRVRMVGARSGRDWTDAMEAFAARRVRALAALVLSGYVLKSASPSCGLEGVSVRGGAPDGRGLFAAALLKAMPGLPVEEERRLRDPAVRESWLARVFAYSATKGTTAGR